MKIAQIVCTYPPYKGGMGNVAYNFTERLRKCGFEVEVFAPRKNPPPNLPLDYKREEAENFGLFLKIGNGAIIPELLWKLKKFDVIHIHLPFIGSTWPILFYPRKKIIVTYHMDLKVPGILGAFAWVYKKTILPLVLQKARKITVSSFDYVENSDIASYFKKHKEKFIELPFGADENKFYPMQKDANLMQKYGISLDDKVAIFVGGLDRAHYFKGLDVLIKAISDLNLKLLVVGSGDMEGYYKKQINEKVIFAGSVSNEELAKYYNLADFIILPSTEKSEAFGIVLVEAALCAKPAIASDLHGVRTVVENIKTGFLSKPKSAQDLKEKIQKMLESDIIKMGQFARIRAKEKYNWGKITEKLIKIYQNSIF